MPIRMRLVPTGRDNPIILRRAGFPIPLTAIWLTRPVAAAEFDGDIEGGFATDFMEDEIWSGHSPSPLFDGGGRGAGITVPPSVPPQ